MATATKTKTRPKFYRAVWSSGKDRAVKRAIWLAQQAGWMNVELVDAVNTHLEWWVVTLTGDWPRKLSRQEKEDGDE